MRIGAMASQGPPADGELSEELMMLLERTLGPHVAIESIARQPSPFVTLFPAEVLTLGLSDGRHLRLFVKHLGPEQAAQPDKQRRDREVRVYEELLRGDSDLPVPTYFGSRRNKVTCRHELYLEHVEDWSLQYHSLEHWFRAAARLADLHAHFASRATDLRACDFLLRLDEVYFDAWAGRAHVAVAEQSTRLGDRLGTLRGAYAPVCNLLAGQPVTLVHNDLACKNVIADRSSTPARICIVDWELAGVGCGLLDLVHLKYGLDPADDVKMIAIYRARLRATELLPADDREMARLLAACELHKTLYRLAHSPAWRLPLDKLAQWVAEAEVFLQRVLET
jgi:aminoglycoside phosphotransferase (APT) family kinase protein